MENEGLHSFMAAAPLGSPLGPWGQVLKAQFGLSGSGSGSGSAFWRGTPSVFSGRFVSFFVFFCFWQSRPSLPQRSAGISVGTCQTCLWWVLLLLLLLLLVVVVVVVHHHHPSHQNLLRSSSTTLKIRRRTMPLRRPKTSLWLPCRTAWRLTPRKLCRSLSRASRRTTNSTCANDVSPQSRRNLRKPLKY